MNDLQNSYQQENNYDFKIDSNYIVKSKSISEKINTGRTHAF